MRSHGDRHALVQLAPERVDDARVLRDLLLLPAVGDRLQEHDQRGRRCDVDSRAAPVSTRLGSCSQAARKNASSGRNMTTNSGVGELSPVRLRRELLECSRTWRAWSSRRCCRTSSSSSPARRGMRRGHLRIDDDVLPSWQTNDQVGAESTVLGRCRDLLVEVAVVEHSGDLDDALELDLAPAPRTCGVRSAFFRDAVCSPRSVRCRLSSPYPFARARSSYWTRRPTARSDSSRGLTVPSRLVAAS